MPNYLKLAAESALSVLGVRSHHEQPRYRVLEYVGSVELRAYGPRLAAETTVSAPDEGAARKEAFGILAAYIFGRNRTLVGGPVETGAEPAGPPREIAMTTPVGTAPVGAGRFTMRFFLPGELARESAPVPLDARVRLVDLPGETLAALAFSGSTAPAAIERRKRELLDTLRPSAWRPAGEPITLLYDPPFTPPFLRRNEVAVAAEPAPRAVA